MIFVRKFIPDGVTKTDEGNYKVRLNFFLHPDDETVETLRDYLRTKHKAKYAEIGGDDFDITTKSLYFDIIESTEDIINEVIRSVTSNESLALLHTSSTYASTKLFIEFRLKFMDFSKVEQ
jgi:hypothetical protein